MTTILRGGGSTFVQAKIASRAAELEQGLSGGTLGLGLLGYVLLPSMLTLFWGGYFARRGEWGLALTPLILLAVYSLVALQRFTFVYSAVLFSASYYYHGRYVPRRERVPIPRAKATGLILLAAIVVSFPLLFESQRCPVNLASGPRWTTSCTA